MEPLYIGSSLSLLTGLDVTENGVTTAEPHAGYERYVIIAVDSKSQRVIKKYARDAQEGYDSENLTVVDSSDTDLMLKITSEVSKKLTNGADLLLYTFVADEDTFENCISKISVGPWLDNPAKNEAQ